MGSGAAAEFSAFIHRRWSQLVRPGFVLPGGAGLAEDLAQTALAPCIRGSAARVTRTIG